MLRFSFVLSLIYHAEQFTNAEDLPTQVILEVGLVSLTYRTPASVSLHTNSKREKVGRGAVWVRGSSAQLHPKKSYRLEFQDENGKDSKTEFLGMPSESDWVLYPAYRDKTFVRDILAYDLWREVGYYAPRWRFVELFIVRNSTAGVATPAKATIQPEWLFSDEYRFVPQINLQARPPPIPPEKPWIPTMPDIETVWPGISKQGIRWEHYQGVYILMEKIKRGKHRVCITKLKKDDSTEPAVTGGYIFKRDRLNAGESGFTSSKGIRFAYEEPKESEITPAQRSYLTKYINDFEQALFSDYFTDHERGYRKYIDVDSFIDYHWIVEATRNVDGYTFSVFFHKDRNGKLKVGPLWDWDLSFGGSRVMGGSRKEGWQFERVAGPAYDWYKRLFEDPDFLQRYIDRWADLRTNILATSNILARIDQYINALGTNAIDRNYKRWPTLGKRIYPSPTVGDTYEAEVVYLKNWITGRLAWIDTQDFPPPAIRFGKPESSTINALLVLKTARPTEITMSCQVGKIYYTTDNSDPRLSGGGVSAKALEYTQPFLLPSGTVLFARVKSEHELWSAPRILRVQ